MTSANGNKGQKNRISGDLLDKIWMGFGSECAKFIVIVLREQRGSRAGNLDSSPSLTTSEYHCTKIILVPISIFPFLSPSLSPVPSLPKRIKLFWQHSVHSKEYRLQLGKPHLGDFHFPYLWTCQFCLVSKLSLISWAGYKKMEWSFTWQQAVPVRVYYISLFSTKIW